MQIIKTKFWNILELLQIYSFQLKNLYFDFGIFELLHQYSVHEPGHSPQARLFGSPCWYQLTQFERDQMELSIRSTHSSFHSSTLEFYNWNNKKHSYAFSVGIKQSLRSSKSIFITFIIACIWHSKIKKNLWFGLQVFPYQSWK